MKLHFSDSSSVHHREFIHCNSAMVYVIQVCRQISDRTRSCPKAAYKRVWHILLLSVQWINSWWWTEEVSEKCIVSCQNKFVKLVHLVGFIIKKFVTMHGHMNVKKAEGQLHLTLYWLCMEGLTNTLFFIIMKFLEQGSCLFCAMHPFKCGETYGPLLRKIV